MKLGTAKWRIRFTIELDYDGPAEEEFARFHLEENHCVKNIIRHLFGELQEGVCNECARAEVKLLGPAAPRVCEMCGAGIPNDNGLAACGRCIAGQR